MEEVNLFNIFEWSQSENGIDLVHKLQEFDILKKNLKCDKCSSEMMVSFKRGYVLCWQ